jgi:RNA polymerase sigma factor (sigma-70 family)
MSRRAARRAGSGRSLAQIAFSAILGAGVLDVSTGTKTDIQRLLDRHRQGDTQARNELLERSYNRLLKIASTLFQEDFSGLRGRHDLESVVDETWMSLRRALETTQPETADGFFGLVFLKVRQALLQIANRQRRHDLRRRDGPLDAGEPEALDVFDRPDTTNEPRRLAILTEFHCQVDKLPADERRVFELHYYLGLTQEETARLIEVHPRQVSRLWLKAAGRLAKWFRDAEGLT